MEELDGAWAHADDSVAESDDYSDGESENADDGGGGNDSEQESTHDDEDDTEDDGDILSAMVRTRPMPVNDPALL